MKKFLFALAFLAVGLVLVWCLARNQATNALRHGTNGPSALTATQNGAVASAINQASENPTVPSLAVRNKMPVKDHIAWLEQYGIVPEDADPFEWSLAQQTRWWGEPLDPKKFWAGKTIWLSKDAVAAAQRKGRGYPPPPYEDAALRSYPEDKARSRTYYAGGGPEGGGRDYRGSSKERAFWERFAKSHPRPPEDLEREQFALAERIFGSRELPVTARGVGAPVRISPEIVREGARIQSGRLLESGYPPELVSESALYWAYVGSRRQEFAELIPNTPISKSLLSRTTTDPKLITDPLAPDQVAAGKAWKIAYLQRLRKENTDESYINSYLKAWNLSAAEVFK